jgi:hypothetical protein
VSATEDVGELACPRTVHQRTHVQLICTQVQHGASCGAVFAALGVVCVDHGRGRVRALVCTYVREDKREKTKLGMGVLTPYHTHKCSRLYRTHTPIRPGRTHMHAKKRLDTVPIFQEYTLKPSRLWWNVSNTSSLRCINYRSTLTHLVENTNRLLSAA